jgi:redox-sensitive bicupin YhaK (pirin superfamily)
MVQLWVNLPAKDKMSPPATRRSSTPTFRSLRCRRRGTVRVIAGEFDGTKVRRDVHADRRLGHAAEPGQDDRARGE